VRSAGVEETREELAVCGVHETAFEGSLRVQCLRPKGLEKVLVLWQEEEEQQTRGEDWDWLLKAQPEAERLGAQALDQQLSWEKNGSAP